MQGVPRRDTNLKQNTTEQAKPKIKLGVSLKPEVRFNSATGKKIVSQIIT